MSVDDLSTPLGKPKPKRRFPVTLPRWKLPALPLLPVLTVLLGLGVVGFVAWGFLVHDPLGGEPVAKVSIAGRPDADKPGAPQGAAKAPDAHGAPAHGAQAGRADAHGAAPPSAGEPQAPAGNSINIIDGTTGKAREVVVPRMVDGMTPSPDPRVSDRSRHGTIPKIASDGARPSEVYARPALVPPSRANLPRIAIIVGGLGVSASGTAEAVNKLPADVTLAFTPYGGDLDRVVSGARSVGHEVMLQVPMEPNDYPDSDPGPQTLLTTLTGEQNVDRLHWFMSRFTGFVGVVNFMGARFISTEGSLSPVMREIAKRGLIYLDDGAVQRSVVKEVAGTVGTAFVRADVVLDAVASPNEIDAALMRLERAASERGVAIGYATAMPVSLDRLVRWAKEAEARGVTLVPLSAVALRGKKAS